MINREGKGGRKDHSGWGVTDRGTRLSKKDTLIPQDARKGPRGPGAGKKDPVTEDRVISSAQNGS